MKFLPITITLIISRSITIAKSTHPHNHYSALHQKYIRGGSLETSPLTSSSSSLSIMSPSNDINHYDDTAAKKESNANKNDNDNADTYADFEKKTIEDQSEVSKFQRILIKEANYNPSPANNYHNIENYTPKRSSYIAWDPYFLAIAKLTSQRSKDPHKQVGACIVDSNNRILGVGYNGFPRGCSDDVLPWSTREDKEESTVGNGSTKVEKNDLHSKEYYMVQAEINAILNKIGNVAGAIMYVYGSFPCNECAKIIIQAGIKEVVYMDVVGDSGAPQVNDEKCDKNKVKASRILFGLAGVKLTNYTEILHQNEDGSSMIPTIPDLNFDFPHSDDRVMTDTLSPSSSSSSMTSKKLNDAIEISEEDRQLLIKEANYDPIQGNQQQQQQQQTSSQNNSNDNNNKTSKRQDYLSWDDYFTAVASLSAYRSKDPNTQVGACIVDENKCIIGIGYNGFPRGCCDDHLPWSRKAPNPLHTKYLYVVHAEVNAILNKGSKDCTGATLYVALFPCNDCAKVIIQSGIKEVVYLSDTYHDTDICKASRILFEMAGVKCRQYFPSRKRINVDILNRSDE